MIEKKITVTAGDDEFEFCVKTNDYNSYINALKLAQFDGYITIVYSTTLISMR